MITNLVMITIVIFLVATLVIKTSFREGEKHFFDKDNSNALRGFWCLIVVLVHVPELYQNRIQDMLGSFAYIGVTFFFMTSAYGLCLKYLKCEEQNMGFWKNRLPKLLVPCFVVNSFSLLVRIIEKEEIDMLMILKINDWVIWLLICYFFFWIDYKFIKSYKNLLVIALICMFSILIYFLKQEINRTTWCPEIMGFIWGIILYYKKDYFKKKMSNNWIIKLFVCLCISMITGCCYLKFKTIYFWGEYILKILLGFLIILFMLTFNVKINIGNKINKFLGEISFEVYLVHGVIFGTVASISPQIVSGIFIAVSLLFTVIIAYILHYIGKHILQRINKILN